MVRTPGCKQRMRSSPLAPRAGEAAQQCGSGTPLPRQRYRVHSLHGNQRLSPATSQGMTGKSSGRGTWVAPKVCHSTGSAPGARLRLAAVHLGRPSPPLLWMV
jgi:hypothetical protein